MFVGLSVICLTEACLNYLCFDYKIFQNDFTIFPSDRVSSCGGVPIAVSSEVFASKCRHNFKLY